MIGQEWWFARLYPGSPAAMDTVAAGASRWAKATVAEIGARYWYFIRYVDTSGVHIRLRIQADPDVLDELGGRLEPLHELVATAGTDGENRRLLPEAGAMDIKGPPGVRLACYEPEVDKYGSDHLAGAEVAFRDSSELLLDLDATAKPQPGARAGLAAGLMREAASAVLTEAEQARFWPFHRSYWGEHLRQLRLSKQDLRARFDVVTAVVAEHPPNTAEVELLRDWSARLASVIHSAPPPRRSQLFFHHLHMTMNRLGYLPAEEAMLGLAVTGGGRR
ncbi:thiopeptide-type bacteriocin biosynthesis protein [Amycolatopsis sp. cg5]|uniref:thiopeptide-type bacteriocin biosynthesis protein n=1 Tax=Amycolatopsis sp. cg5 TaxID=3238802 RepID=UPI0035250B8B